MDFSSMLRPEFRCACGQIHRCDTRAIYVGKNALSKLPEYLSGYKRLLVVSDLNTRAACGEAAVKILTENGFEVREACFPQTEHVEPDEEAIAFLEARMDERIEAVVGVGGGVINDLTKYLAHAHGVPNLYVCTAPSMDGIATNTSVLTQKGLKFTIPQQVPRWIIADIDVLCSAPMVCIRAGLGDVLGKYSALSDWKLAKLLTGEALCEPVYNWVDEGLRAVAENIDGCMRREPEAIGILAESLILIGVAAGYVLVSRPGSGAEHLLAHYFEIYGQVHHEPYFSHGENVGHCSLIVERLRKRLLTEDPAAFAHRFDREKWEAGLRRRFPAMADDIIAMQDKADTHEDHVRSIVEAWPEIRAILSETPGPEVLGDQLRRAGFDPADFRALYGEENIRAGVRYCNDMKVKHTLIQVIEDAGLLERYAAEIEI